MAEFVIVAALGLNRRGSEVVVARYEREKRGKRVWMKLMMVKGKASSA